ncbi:Protein fam86a [Halocaridina rubra]|uniref:Protein fam86a n=1 Tax=Halocaridina rubra TaxID=373956 RepID=A0AAN8WRU1_HALRR
MMGDLNAYLCYLLTRAYFACVPTTRTLWSHVSCALDAAQEELPPDDIMIMILKACIEHPLSSAAPRDPKHEYCVLKWISKEWESRGWALPNSVIKHKALKEPQDCPELCYKTYIGWGGGKNQQGVTLLESCGGIVHHTTGLTTWGGAAVLADWVTNQPDIIANRRVLELGAGIGFTASVVLTTGNDDYLPPRSYIATDCHHHVLTLLQHNLELNLNPEPVMRKTLEAFQESTGKLLVTEEAQIGEMLPWKPISKKLRLSSKTSLISEDEEDNGTYDNMTAFGTTVEVLQVDWRDPPLLPNVDVIIAADVVYAHHLIPPLVELIKGILNGTSSRRKSDKISDHVKMQRLNSMVQKENIKHSSQESLEKCEELYSNNEEMESLKTVEHEIRPNSNSNNPNQDTESLLRNSDKDSTQVDQEERAAYIACTRRTLETVNLFLDEVTKQGLSHSLVYQSTLDTDTFLFLYNETHLPVKIFKLILAPENTCN